MDDIEVVGDDAGVVTSVPPWNEITKPNGFQLCQNFPNPSNPSTGITFYSPQTECAATKVYSRTGQEIETLVKGELPAEEHQLLWRGNGLASGVYVYEMQAGEYRDAKRMIYQK